MSVNYEAMKAEYTSDPYNIPEKLYAYYNANGYSRLEVIDMNDKIEKAIYQGGVAERIIPEGKNKKSYQDLMELLGSFGFDHNYSISMKRKLIREIGSSVLARIPYPPSKPLDMSFFDMYNEYYQTTGNSGNEYADPNATTPKEGGRRKGRKGRKTGRKVQVAGRKGRKTRRNRKSQRRH
jgi:hypothetical protein